MKNERGISHPDRQIRLGLSIAVGALIGLLAGLPALAADLSPARDRFASGATSETPDFQRHVIPLLGQLGCNSRTCHGSFQGQGGFQLSLFGYDFKKDLAALTRDPGDAGKPRVNTSDPASSLVLQKPMEQVDHEGGQRFEMGSWQHHLLLGWIQSGAKVPAREHRLASLEVRPSEIQFHQLGETASLQVIAVWADGLREDVTCLSRFRVNDDSVAAVDREGVVRSLSRGDTHVVAFYDNGVAAIPVFHPLAEPYSPPLARTEVDQRIGAKLAKLGIHPSPICSDSEFLRRIRIDLTGTLPSPQEVLNFLADPAPDKRARKIQELLEQPSYAAWWANKLCDYTGNNPQQQEDVGQVLAVQWYQWIYARILQNMPYDQLVAQMVLATGRDANTSYKDYVATMSSYFRLEEPASFADHPTMPHYWARRTLRKPEDKALAFAHSFLGLQLQCAQCHKHPFDQWTQDDFKQFSRLFEPIRYGVAPDGIQEHRRMAQGGDGNMQRGMMMSMGMGMLARAEEGESVPWREVYIDASSKLPRSTSLLGFRQIQIEEGTDPRQPLMDWMREADNPYFARAFVNRVWANYFGMGIIHPPDDLNLANPPSNRDLLEYLERGFIQSGYDMKWLHREIVSSDAYQRSWRPNASQTTDTRNFNRMQPRRLPAEVVYDALAQATASDAEMETVRTQLERRAIGHLSMRMAGTYAMNIFGKPGRSSNCDCERSSETTLLQSVFLMNDPITRNRLRDSGWLAEVETRYGQNPPTHAEGDALVKQAYLRCLGRLPETPELARASAHLSQSSSAREGTEDLLWALVNSKEFLMNH